MGTPVVKKRGISQKEHSALLTIWLIVMVLGNVIVLGGILSIRQYLLDRGGDYAAGLDTPDLISVLYLVLPFVNVTCVILIWFWKKAGLYLYVGSVTLAIILNLSVNVPIIEALLGLVGLGILYALMRPKWRWYK